MSTIRFTSRQMTAPLEGDAAFAEWFVEEVMQVHLPQYYWAVSPQGLREMTLNGRSYARWFGFDDPPSQAQFIMLMWQIGPNFYLQPGFAEALADRSGSAEARIARLYEVPAAQAEAAVTRADDRYWYPQMVPTPQTGGQA